MNKENKTQNTDLNSLMVQLQDFFELYLVKNAPAIPDKYREDIVHYTPYLTIFGVVSGAWAFLASFGLLSPFSTSLLVPGYNIFAFLNISNIAFIISIVLEGMAISGLFARKLSAWSLMYYSILIMSLASILKLDFVSAVIGMVVGMYFLFQVKSYYK